MEEETKQHHVPKIYGAIASIMADTKSISKGRKNDTQGFMFRGIDDVMNELHGIFAGHGVFILPEVIDFTVSEKTSSRGGLLYYTRAKIKFHFVAEDGSEVFTVNVGEAMDSGDKGMNKAMSIALKYSLMQMLLIPTQESKDPDATTPEETRPRTIAEIRQSLDVVKDSLLIKAIEEMINAKDKATMVAIWERYSDSLKSNPTFTQCMTTRKKELGL